MSVDRASNIALQKKAARKEIFAALKSLTPGERSESDAFIRSRLESIPLYQRASTIFIFVGDGWEVDTWPLIEAALARGKRVAVPRCIAAPSGAAVKTEAEAKSGATLKADIANEKASVSGVMEACLINSKNDLSRTEPWGLWEPAAGSVVIAPEEIDFAVIPCMACDIRGHRLGRGGGFYDRYLAGRSFTKAALCRDIVLRDQIPTEYHDVALDFVVTESKLIETATA